MVDTVSFDGSADDINPKPEDGGAPPASAPDGNGDGISIFDSIAVVALSVAVCSSSGAVVAAGVVCMKLKLDAAGISSGAAAAAVSLLSSLEGDPLPPKKEKALEGAVSGTAATGAGAGAAAIKENPEEGGSTTAGAGSETGSGVDM
jgi:hypothetical protein